jgi:hypothetical protein
MTESWNSFRFSQRLGEMHTIDSRPMHDTANSEQHQTASCRWRVTNQTVLLVHHLVNALTTPSTFTMTASTFRIPLSAHNHHHRRHCAIHPLPQDKATKQSIVPKNNLNEDNDEAVQSKEPMFPIRRSGDIFRRQTSEVDSDLEGMWALKRANPVNLDDDDEESLEADLYQSPTKRSRTQVLNWEDLDSLMTLSSGSSHLGP